VRSADRDRKPKLLEVPSVTESMDSGFGTVGFIPEMTPITEHTESRENANGSSIYKARLRQFRPTLEPTDLC